ncbi:YidH family protein [Marivita sp. S0852]|uniref:YidH family protein n=1 Tax=Marivita sp. S0852 TaxID=3373893 RepID=UPI003982901C
MSDKTGLAKDRTEYAENRTDWAEDRTVLANERTFAGWLRTGMASVAIALGLRALFRPYEPTWVPKVVATVFIVAALLIFVSAWRQAKRTKDSLSTHDANGQSRDYITVITIAFGIGTSATGVILWLL